MAIKEKCYYPIEGVSTNGSSGGYTLPKLPSWASGYSCVAIGDPDLAPIYILASNSYEIKPTSSVTYGTQYITYAIGAVKSELVNGEWSEPVSVGDSCYFWARVNGINDNNFPFWANFDIPCATYYKGEYKERIELAGSSPKMLAIEIGWTDYGSDGRIMDLTDRTMTIYKGWSVAGAIRCSVIGASADSFTFEWYENGNMVYTQKNRRTYSDYKPSSKQTGSFSLYCKVTSDDGMSLTTDSIHWKVAVYDPGGGGSGGETEDEVIGGGIILSSRVTDIVLTVSPDTVVPGGHSLIEVSVNGIGSYSQAFTAQIGGHASAATHMVTGGYTCNVWIGEDETADYVLVTVTSVQDPTITATEMVYIDQSATEEEDTAADKLQIAYWKGYATARAYFQQTRLSASATIRITKEEEEPSTEAGQLKRAFWKGFVACLGTFDIVPAEYVAYLENGVLYIEKAPAVLNGNTLEV